MNYITENIVYSFDNQVMDTTRNSDEQPNIYGIGCLVDQKVFFLMSHALHGNQQKCFKLVILPQRRHFLQNQCRDTTQN